MARVFSGFIPHSKSVPHFVLRRSSSKANLKPEIFNCNKLSTLFVSGRHGAEMYQVVKPIIDIDFITSNLGILKLSCDHRGIKLDLDYVLQLSKDWLGCKEAHRKVVELDREYRTELENCSNSGLKDEVEALNEKRKEHEQLLIESKTKLHDVEDIIMPLFQKIPHILHMNTPLQFNVIDDCKEPPALSMDVKSHTEIARHQSWLHFMNNSATSYFMTGKLSQLDLALQSYFMDKMNSCNFLPLSCVSFCKSFIIEAIGYDPYSDLDSILIKKMKNDRELGQKLHVVGGASFETLCGYLINMNVDKSTFPVSYFSLGRRYNAANKLGDSQSLFSVVQSVNVHGMILSESSSLNTFDSLLQTITDIYSELNLPFRLVNIAARNLTIAESRRKQLEVWSPALKDYVPIAYVSQHDDFVSKRLKITYGIEHVIEGHCHIVEGTIVNMATLIGCIVENYQRKGNDFDVPTVLQKYFSLYSE